MKRRLLDIPAADLAERIVALGEKPFRAGQILEWIWRKGVYDFEGMTNLSAELRRRLSGEFCILSGQAADRSDAKDGVVKLLLQFPDGEQIETVLIPSARRSTACISTQVGCAMGCTFCASAVGGLRRNLTAGEIVEQVLQLQASTEQHATHVVFMGIGEPLANYDATVQAVRTLIDPAAGGVSARRITISTVALPKAILKLAREDLPITLAISLHAPNDALRAELMPAAAKYPIKDILAAGRQFFQARKREVTLEYTLLRDVNDTQACATELADIARSLRCNVNLIGYNPVASLPFRPVTTQATQTFAHRLAGGGVNVHIRRSRGLDANAACGQLRAANAIS